MSVAETLRSLDVPMATTLVLTAGVYARGWMRLRRRMPRRFGWPQLAAFLVGLDVLFMALAPPLEALAAESLTVHMTQHLLLMMVAPPLLWLGAPLAPILRGLPTFAMNAVIATLAWRPVRQGGRAFSRP